MDALADRPGGPFASQGLPLGVATPADTLKTTTGVGTSGDSLPSPNAGGMHSQREGWENQENAQFLTQNTSECLESGCQKGPEPIPFAPMELQPLFGPNSGQTTPRDKVEDEVPISETQDYTPQNLSKDPLGTCVRFSAREPSRNPVHAPPALVPLPEGGDFRGNLHCEQNIPPEIGPRHMVAEDRFPGGNFQRFQIPQDILAKIGLFPTPPNVPTFEDRLNQLVNFDSGVSDLPHDPPPCYRFTGFRRGWWGGGTWLDTQSSPMEGGRGSTFEKPEFR
jgi:hypothetical protein